jgi:DNA-binding GntR family transcriptional regulator
MSGALKPFDEIDVSPSLATRAYHAIRRALVTVEIPPGAPVQEDALARRLQMGRTPVREALKRLETEQLVVIYPRRGVFATDVRPSDLGLLTEVRAPLEGEAAFHAARRVSRRQRTGLTELRDLAARCPASATEEIDVDGRLHRAVAAAAHNPYLEATLAQYHAHILRVWHLYLDRLPEVTSHLAEMVAVVDAVLAGDAEAARRRAVDHVRSFQRAVDAVL